MQTTEIVGFLLLSLAAAAAQAGGWYVGASAGVVDTDTGGFDDTTNAGVLLGYDVYTRDIFAVSLEGEATTSVSDGDVSINGFDGNWDIDTQAAYVAARLGDRFYIKVRYGVLREDVSVKIAGFSQSDSDTGGSWGAALGWMVTPRWGVQLDGTLVDSGTTYWNAGIKYHFQ
ncbi:MAG: outer membrane beta-barrel protein [Thiogranum sp.]